MKTWVLGITVALAYAIMAVVTAGDAEGSPCVHRSAAHVAEHGGLAADSAWHVAHGQPPTCGDEDKPASTPRDDRDDDNKSRWCRKHWYC
ncbi:hypothetical protein SHEEN_75 [Mycobacterium phage Sheen]|uniref:RDF protein n=1 Tax=Mycobacterium phage Sheen TaxID=1589274 RepID=A0A0B5A0Y4_9CAUD|nr:site-specific recombination directionality factor RDF [Mycobacterium phage Sheen]AJD82493.1 hypothetical protein SHEEN_75 [Mycobacterium phage Sheen]